MRKIDRLTLTQVTSDIANQTCGPYYYLVQLNHGPHKAFRTESGLRRWMDERGLALTQPLAPKGEFRYQPISGAYVDCMMMDQDKFDAMRADFETRQLSNGSYTLAKVIRVDGVSHVHYLNPNCRCRVVFDFQESCDLLDDDRG